MPSAQTLPRTFIIKPSLVEQHMHAERVHVVLGPNMNDLMHNFFVFYLKIPRRIMLKLGNHEADLVTSKHQAGSAKDWQLNSKQLGLCLWIDLQNGSAQCDCHPEFTLGINCHSI